MYSIYISTYLRSISFFRVLIYMYIPENENETKIEQIRNERNLKIECSFSLSCDKRDAGGISLEARNSHE
jgi:hypothetical protein